MWDKSSRGQQITILTDTLKSLTISLLIVHWVGKWIIIGQSTEVRLYNWIIFALLMTCSITEWLADLQKLAGQLKQQPPQGGSLAKKKIVACYPICRVQEAFNENIISASDCVWWSMCCVCVWERERQKDEQMMENEAGLTSWKLQLCSLPCLKVKPIMISTEQRDLWRSYTIEKISQAERWAAACLQGLTQPPTAPRGGHAQERPDEQTDWVSRGRWAAIPANIVNS